MEYPKISICIPTMDRWDLHLKDYIPQYLTCELIDEIVISDENGNDVAKIKNAFPDNPKLRLFVNSIKIGAFSNKEKSVSLARNEWVALIDSDNFAPQDYFEAWRSYISINGADPFTVYCPEHTITTHGGHCLNYKNLTNTVIDNTNIKSLLNVPNVECVINTGNYIVNRLHYLSAKYTDLPKVCYQNNAWECKLKSFFMIKYGLKLIVIKDMVWFHGISTTSLYSATIDNINRVKGPVLDFLENIKPAQQNELITSPSTQLFKGDGPLGKMGF